MKLLCTFFNKYIRSKNCLVKAIRDALKENTRWWSLLMGIIESDFLVLCLYSLNQISLSYTFCFENKINLVAAIGFFLVLFLYGTVAYSLLHESYRKRTANMLIFSKHHSTRSYCLESTIILMIKLFKSFAHSALLASNSGKFVLLCSLDLVLVVFIILNRGSFYNKAHFIVYLLYQVGVGSINTLLVLKSASLIDTFGQF